MKIRKTKSYEDMTNEEIIAENKRIMNQTEKLIKITGVVLIFTFIAQIILILLKLKII